MAHKKFPLIWGECPSQTAPLYPNRYAISWSFALSSGESKQPLLTILSSDANSLAHALNELPQHLSSAGSLLSMANASCSASTYAVYPHRLTPRFRTARSPPCCLCRTRVSLRALQLSVCFPPHSGSLFQRGTTPRDNKQNHNVDSWWATTPAVDTTTLCDSVHSPLAEAPVSLPAPAARSLGVHPNSKVSALTSPPPRISPILGAAIFKKQSPTFHAQSAYPS